jgi:hypothetical protein
MRVGVDGPVRLSDWHAEATLSEGIIGGVKWHMANGANRMCSMCSGRQIGTVRGVRCARLQRRVRLGDD